MAMQKTVKTYPATGFAGQSATIGQTVYSPYNWVSDGTLKAGGFAFVGTRGTDEMAMTGIATNKGVAADFLGFVVRTLVTAKDGTDPAVYIAGAPVTIAEHGDFYIESTGAAAIGNKVLVTSATGAVTYAASATEGTVDTGWVVKTAATGAGETILIGRHGNIPAA